MALTQVKTSGIADDAVTLAKQAAGTDGQIITYDASGNPTAVGPGTDGQVLTSTGAGSPPAFEDAAGGATINNATADELVTVASTTTQLDAEANLTFDGTDLTLGTGNLIIGTSGKGIDFSATGDASGMGSELLDDYEEGSWEPSIEAGGTGMSHYGSNYTRVGDIVHLQGYVHAFTGTTNSATVQIGTLPFTVDTADEYPGACVMHSTDFTSTGNWVTPVVSGQIIKFMGSKDGAAWYTLVGSDDIANGNTIMFNITYRAA